MKISCKGCLYSDCPYTRHNKECPCPKCLVKVTCDMACVDYNKFKRYRDEQHRLQLQETWI